MKTYDAIVIGAGQSGPLIAQRLATSGQKVALVERKKFGGTCVNYGCYPTKVLHASAEAAYRARNAGEFGIRIGAVEVDFAAVMARQQGIVSDTTKGVEEWLGALDTCTLYHGHATFENERTVRVEDETLKAERIFIDVGGRAHIPPEIPGLGEVPYLDNISILQLKALPEHLVIIGGGYIGVEFAQIFRRLGSRVTVLARGDRILSRDDVDISTAIAEILTGEGIEIVNTLCDFEVHRDGDAITVQVDCKGEIKRITGSHLLVATGRVPNTHDLGLDKAGIAANERGFIQVDDQLRTSAPGIWATGDCNGLSAFTHTSYYEGEVVTANLLHGANRKVTDRIPASNLYTDPPLGMCGMNEAQVRASGRKVLVGKFAMQRAARARFKAETRGFMKVFVDAHSKQILGAALLGLECDEIIHTILDVMYAKAPYTVIQNAMHIHPTVSEYLPVLLGDLKPLE